MNNGSQLLVVEAGHDNFEPPLALNEILYLQLDDWHIPLKLNELRLCFRVTSHNTTFAGVAEKTNLRELSGEELLTHDLGFKKASIRDLDDRTAGKISGIGADELARIDRPICRPNCLPPSNITLSPCNHLHWAPSQVPKLRVLGPN